MTTLVKFKLRVRNNTTLFINNRCIKITTDKEDGHYVKHSGSVNSTIDLSDTSIIGIRFVLENGLPLCVGKDYERDIALCLLLPSILDIIKISGNAVRGVLEFPYHPTVRGVKLTNSPALTFLPEELPSNITDVGSMLYGCNSFTQDISMWSLDNVQAKYGGPNMKPY